MPALVLIPTQPRKCCQGKLTQLSLTQAVSDSDNIAMQGKESRLHVYDRYNNIKFLLETGSVVSLIPRVFSKSSSGKVGPKLIAANGTSIAAYGHCVLTLNLGLRCQFKWNFMVAAVQTAIIGADFISHFGLLLDLRGR